MTPAEIKQALADKGLSMSAIARRMRPTVTPQHVAAVIEGRESARVRNAIARALGQPVEVVFATDTTSVAA